MKPSRWHAVIGLTVLALCASGCVLSEDDDYVVQSYQGTLGAHLTIKAIPTGLLHWVSDSVTAGANIDPLIAEFTTTGVTCKHFAPVRRLGDRCAYKILRNTKVRGSLSNAYWRELTVWGEFDDFRQDAMGATRPRGEGQARQGSCIHNTFTYVDPMSINWTYRKRSDPKC